MTEQELEYEISQLNAAITTLDEVASWKSVPVDLAFIATRRAAYAEQRRILNAELTRVMLAGR